MAAPAHGREAADMAAGRLDDLEALIERHMAGPFIWGESDCCLAVCNVLADMGCGDPGAAYRGLYADAEGAAAFGSPADIAETICARNRWLEIDPDHAEPGDVGVRQRTLGVKARSWCWKSERGLLVGGRAERAWRVA